MKEILFQTRRAKVAKYSSSYLMLHFFPRCFRLNDLLRQCRWARRLYKCEDMFKPINTSYGLCFVFNGPQRRPEDRVHSSGTWSSLRVLAYTQNNKSYFSRLIHAGVKVSYNKYIKTSMVFRSLNRLRGHTTGLEGV